MLQNGSPPQPKLVAEIVIKVTDNGQVGINVGGSISQLDLFGVLGTVQSLLAEQYKKQAEQQIQVAPAGLLNRLPQG